MATLSPGECTCDSGPPRGLCRRHAHRRWLKVNGNPAAIAQHRSPMYGTATARVSGLSQPDPYPWRDSNAHLNQS